MNNALERTSLRRVRRPWLCIAFAMVIGTPGPSSPQEKPPPGVDQLRSALSVLAKTLTDKSFKDAGIGAGTLIITVLNDNLTYIPSEFHAPVGVDTTIIWISADGPFALAPLGTSPLDRTNIHSEPQGNVHIAKAIIQKTAQPGTYHYAVGLYSGGKVYLDPNCPPIIIERVLLPNK